MGSTHSEPDTLDDVMGCVREAVIEYMGSTCFGEIVIRCRISKHGVAQIDVDRGPTHRFHLRREERTEVREENSRAKLLEL